MKKTTTKMDERNKELGKKLQECRKQGHVTQKEMAAFCGVSKNHLARIEQGGCKCPAHMFIDYGKRLNISLDDIVKPTTSSMNIIPELRDILSHSNEEKQKTFLAIIQALEKEE